MLFKRHNSLLSETPFTVNPVNSLDSFGGHVDSDALCVCPVTLSRRGIIIKVNYLWRSLWLIEGIHCIDSLV